MPIHELKEHIARVPEQPGVYLLATDEAMAPRPVDAAAQGDGARVEESRDGEVLEAAIQQAHGKWLPAPPESGWEDAGIAMVDLALPKGVQGSASPSRRPD